MRKEWLWRIGIVAVVAVIVITIYAFSETQCEWGRIPVCTHQF